MSNDHYDGHMDRTMTATEVKAKLLAVLDEVEGGEEIAITRHGRMIARIVPARGPHRLRGLFAGVTSSSPNDEDLFSTGLTWDVT
jgi:prevent-host-death family protein